MNQTSRENDGALLITQSGKSAAAPPSRLAHEAVVTEDGPHPAVQLEP
jgi:hypothetical protein